MLATTRKEFTDAVKSYIDDLDALLKQVDTRLGAILVKLNFRDVTTEYKTEEVLQKYNYEIVAQANEYTNGIARRKTVHSSASKMPTKHSNVPGKSVRLHET